MPRNSVTCQASADRQIPRLCIAPEPVNGVSARRRDCGSQLRSASSGKTISSSSAPRQPNPAIATGTTSAEPSAAAPPIVRE